MADNQYWEVLQWRESKNGKNWAVKLGSAKQKDDGGFYVDLNCYPIPTMDDRGQLRCSFVIQPPKGEYKPRQQASGGQRGDYTSAKDVDESEVPF